MKRRVHRPLTALVSALAVLVALGTGVSVGADAPAGVNVAIPVAPATDHLVLTAPVGTTAGSPFSLVVTAVDASGATTPGYRGTVHFSSSDSQALLAPDYAFTGDTGDHGSHSFTLTLKASGSQAISATDSTNGAITGSASALVAAAAADHLSVVAPIITVAGVPFLVDATAQDSFGNIAGYRGTVHFTSSDSQAVLPPDYTFTATDAGQHSFLATLKTAGSRSVGATDTVAPTIAGTASILVLPGAATQFVLSAPASAGAGVPLSLQVTAEDSFGNVTSGYRGTVHLSSGDGAATLPLDYPFSALDAGSHAFTVTLRTAGVRSLAANDAALGVAGTTSVEVIPAAANKLAFHDQPANGAAGAIFQVTVEELDAFGNRETADSTTRVTVSLGGGPAEAALLGTLTQTAAGGLATFTDLSVQRAGTGYVLHATGGALTPDDSQAFAVSPAELARIVAIPATAAITFGASQSYTIEGFDRFGNSRGDVTSATTLTIAPDGVCVSGTCTPGHAGPHTITADDGGVRASTTLAVGTASTSLSVAVAGSVQYSDPVMVAATVSPASVLGSSASGTVQFSIGALVLGSAPVVAGGSAEGAFILPKAPGSYTVSAVYTPANTDFAGSTGSTSLSVTPEDARVTYTGPMLALTPCASCSTASVPLSATVKDMTAVDAVADPFAGDIRNAVVTFKDRGTGTTLCAASVGLVSPVDTKTGTATCTWSSNLGVLDFRSVQVNTVVGNFYARDSAVDDQLVTVSRPMGRGSVLGGGYLRLGANSNGACAGASGSVNGFGFGVKSSPSVAGVALILVRSARSCTPGMTGPRTYLVVAPTTTFVVLAGSPVNRATFYAKASIWDVTDPAHPTSVDRNATLRIDTIDGGSAGAPDTLGITLWNTSGGLWFSSDWNGSQTVQDSLAAGNVIVR